MDFAVIDLNLAAKLLLLLLIGMAPKIALVPFLEKTAGILPGQTSQMAGTHRSIGQRGRSRIANDDAAVRSSATTVSLAIFSALGAGSAHGTCR